MYPCFFGVYPGKGTRYSSQLTAWRVTPSSPLRMMLSRVPVLPQSITRMWSGAAEAENPVRSGTPPPAALPYPSRATSFLRRPRDRTRRGPRTRVGGDKTVRPARSNHFGLVAHSCKTSSLSLSLSLARSAVCPIRCACVFRFWLTPSKNTTVATSASQEIRFSPPLFGLLNLSLALLEINFRMTPPASAPRPALLPTSDLRAFAREPICRCRGACGAGERRGGGWFAGVPDRLGAR